jgi:TonB family protein
MIHGAALLVLLFFVLFDLFRPRKSVHVFEMVSLSDAPVAPQTARPEPTPALDLPPLKPMPPEIARPKPREMINIAEFRKKNPTPKPRPAQPPTRTAVSVPKLEVPKLDTSRTQSPSSQLNATQLNALASYNARLRSRIDGAWKKPENLGGLALKLNAVFQVSASGRISNIRFSPGSGNAAFDNSVLAALRSVLNAGPTPTGQGHTFSMRFQLD